LSVQKGTKKPLRAGAAKGHLTPKNPQFYGGFSDTPASEELPCPVNGPHLLALHTGLGASITAARLDKAALASPELSFGFAE